MTLLGHTWAFTLPAAYAVMPPALDSRAASAQLLAVGLQESAFRHRRQVRGPARSLWQFERVGVQGILTHPRSRTIVRAALAALCYPPSLTAAAVHAILEHNDTLACVCARGLLLTLPQALPTREQPEDGWSQYLSAWRPGKPHAATWDANFTTAWNIVTTGDLTSDLTSED